VGATLFITAKLSPPIKPTLPPSSSSSSSPVSPASPASPAIEEGKLLGAYKLWVNGILVTAGPGHGAPYTAQPVNAIDLAPLLRPQGLNVLALAGFFSNASAVGSFLDATPRIQAELRLLARNGSELQLLATSPSWLVADASAFYSPSGETGKDWYSQPNEMLQLPLLQPLRGPALPT
jgi:hypothetical protein